MSSIVPEYNYDIFISYRQKDNKHDGWVTEFINQLKGEIEATFKEDISIYFDENPHDGLLETHNVDKSLEDKLNCLIFIPIISQTYCDPKSYAWQYEFCAFNKLAKEDKFGRDVKLASGNVASRILPVKIHDLDPDDQSLLENELGEVLRSVEFIYKSAGVNRPLRANEDHPQDNLNKTYYRDQINKVANAVKEIINAVKHYNPQKDKITHEATKPTTTPQKSNKTPIFIISVVAIALIILGILFVSKLFKPPKEIEKSIAVLPFRNESTDQENSAFVNGLMEKTLNNLQLIKGFRVISRTSVEQYRNQNKSAPEIAKELGVNYIVEGSGQRYGDAFSLNVQLIKADKREDHLWGGSFEQEIKEIDDILAIQSEIADAIAKALEVNITAEEKQRIDKIPTQSLTAMDFYEQGLEEHGKYADDIYNLAALDKAEDLYNKALKYDTTFAQVYINLAWVYWSKNVRSEYFSENFMDSALVLANTALSYDPDLADAYLLRGDYYWEHGYAERALEEYDKVLDINPSEWRAYLQKANVCWRTDILIAIINMHEAISISGGRELHNLLKFTSFLYRCAGFPEIAKKYAKEALTLDNDSAYYFYEMSGIESDAGNLDESIKYLRKAYMLDTTNLDYLYSLGFQSSLIGNYEEALVFIEKWLEHLDRTLVMQATTYGMYRVGYIYWKNNRFDEANKYFDLQIKYNNDWDLSNLPNNRYNSAALYAFRGQKEKAYEDLRFYKQSHYEHKSYMIALVKIDPFFDSIRDEPEFQQIMRDVEANYHADHERVREWLEENDML